MQREIKFRGKRVDGKGWVTGNYVKDIEGKPFIETQEGTHLYTYEVDPATVGQFIGAYAWFSGEPKKIFEDDVVKFAKQNKASGGILHITAVVKWNPQGAMFWFVNGKYYTEINSLSMYGDETGIYLDTVEHIGNVHDNPELIKTNQQ